METATEFLKLEKIEFGGIKGVVLTLQVQQLFEEFNDKYKVFSERTYDCMDPASNVSMSTAKPPKPHKKWCCIYNYKVFSLMTIKHLLK